MKNRILSSLFLPLFLTSLFPLLLTFLTLFAGSVALAQIPSNGLVAYWPFDGNANDISGNGNNGIVYGATLATDRNGNANSAYSFNGGSNYISVPYSPTIGVQQEVSISFWVYFDGGSCSPRIIQSSPWGQCGGYTIFSNNGSNVSRYFYTDFNNCITQINSPSSPSIGALAWHHVVFTASGLTGITNLYFDGTLAQSVSTNHFFNSVDYFNNPLTIGNVDPYSCDWFGGLLDEIGIYSRILSQSEITQIYTSQTSTIQAPCPTLATNLQTGLVGYWPFCGNANDESGNGNNGTVNGATLTTDRFGNANSAYSFDGVDDFIEVLHSSSLSFPNNTQTISFWIEIQSSPTPQVLEAVMSKYSGSGSSLTGFTMHFTSESLFYSIKNGESSSTWGDCFFNTDNLSPYSVYRNVVFSNDNDSLRCYVNGVLVNTTNLINNTIIIGQNVFPLVFGKENSMAYAGGLSYFDGKLDDICIWDRALTPAEITQLYTAPSVTPPVACTPFLGEDQTVCSGTSVTLSATGSSLACPTLPSSLQNGLVGYWPFCGNANDTSGNGNNGTVNGATLTTDRFGNANSAYSFDGWNDLIQIPNNSSLNFGINPSFSISLWVNKTSANSGGIISKGEPLNGYGWKGWNLYNEYFQMGYPCVNNNSISLAANSWQHLVLKINNGYITSYIDGAQNSQFYCSNITSSSVSTLIDLHFGVDRDLYNFFTGKLDDIAIYNRTLTPSEIQQLYTLGQSTFLWSTGATTASISVTPTQTTTYTCTVTDANGNACTDSVTVFVPQIEATDLTICAGESTTLSVSGINTTSTSVSCGTISSNLQVGLVGYWPLCGNANDISGSGNNGTVSNATLTTDRYGNANGAYNFGTNSFIRTNQVLTGVANNFSYSAIVSPNANLNIPQENTQYNDLSQCVIHPTHGSCFGNWQEHTGAGLYVGQNGVVVTEHSHSYVRVSLSYSGSVIPNSVVTIVYENKTPKLYLNGVLVKTGIADARNVHPSAGFDNTNFANYVNSGFGAGFNGPDNSGQHFNGKIDEIFIWNYTLPLADIQLLNSGILTTYLWSNGATTPTINVSPTTTTTYTCTVTTNGVTCTDSVTVAVNNPTIDLGSDVTVCGTSTTLTAPSGYDSYVWSNGSTTNTTTVTSNGTYTCTVTQGGCSASDAVDVTLIDATISATDSVICAGETITLSVPQGVSSNTSSATLPTNLQNGLVGYWPFSGNANDASGNGNNGIIVGGVSSTTDRYGNQDQAYLFDGTSGYIDVPQLNGLPYKPITYSAWVIVNSYFPSSFGHKFRSIIGRNTGFVVDNGVIGFYADNNAAGGMYDNNFLMWRGGGTNGTAPVSGVIPPLNTWLHVAYTQNAGGDWNWYQNGILTNSGNFTNPQNDFNFFRIGGCNNSTGSFYWNDKLDDIGVWNRPLLAYEIQQLYSQNQTTYSWSTGATTPTIDVSPTTTTTYTCTVNTNGVTCTDSVTVVVNNPTINLGSDVTVCGTSTTLTAPTGYDSYSWSNGGTTNTTTVNANGTYTCTVNQGGCSASDAVDVTLISATITASDSTICAGETTTLSVPQGGSSNTACAALPSNLQTGLVGYWPFCGNANDASGNGNNGTVNGATLTTDRFGNANSAYNFNVANWTWGGGGDFILIPYNPTFNFSEFTVSAWIKRTSDGSTISPQTMSVIRRYQNGYNNPNGESWVLELNHGTSPQGCTVRGSVIQQSPSPAPYSLCTSNNAIDLNLWSSVIMSYSNSTIKLYINGLQQGSTYNPNLTINTIGSSGISIGISDQANGHWGPFDGDIDDISIYSRALSSSEIQQVYSLNPTTYLWSNGATTPTINVSPTSTTTYTCIVTTNGVSCTDSVTVVVNNPTINLGSDVTLCGTSTTLTAPTGYDSYLWSNGGSTNTTTVNANGTYTCTVSQGGCTASDAVDVTLIDATISVTDSIICAGETTTLSVPQGGTSNTGCAALPTNLQNGLVGYWPFCGNSNDESGNGNNGTVNGATLTTDRFGNANSAYSFDGVNDYIQCSQAGPSGNPNITLSFWLRTQSSSYGHLIGYGNNAASGQDVRVLINGNCANSIAFDTYDNQKAKITSFNNSWDYYTVIYNGSIGNNTSVVTVYKNGVLLSSECLNVNISPTNISSQLPIRFGRYHGSAQTGFFDGSLDDIAIYNRVLSVSEIEQLYTFNQTTYSWSTGATTPTINVSPTTTTTYTCTVTSNGVSCTDSVTVVVNNPTINLGSDVTACGTSITLTAPTGYDSYVWSNGAATNTTTVTANGTYTCTVNQGGCSASDVVDVTLIDATISVTDSIICAGETITLSVPQGGSSNTGCAALPTNLQNGLVGYWPFCGNANDASGNGNNGTVNGATLTTDRFGNVNNSYHFDGLNQYIEVPSSSNLSVSAEYTISTWLKADVWSFNSPIDQHSIVSKIVDGDWYGGYEIRSGGINGSIMHSGNISSNFDVGSSGYASNTWHNVIVTFNGSQIKSYINGVLVATENRTGQLQTSNTPLRFGRRGGAGYYNNWFMGLIDDISIYNRALSSLEIQQLNTIGQSTYLWSNGATTPTINVSPTTTTTYTCTVTTNGVSCTDAITVVVGNPVASITPNGIVEICQGQSIALTGNGGVSYLWNTGAPTQSITVNTEAVYTVTVTDANGCTDTESQLVKVNFLPNIGVSNASICAGQSATLTASGGVSYVWSPATGLSATTGSTVSASPATSTLYTVTGTSANGCTNTATAAVTVNALPTATITPATATTFCQGGSVVLNANTGTGLTYQWFNNASAISGATSASYTATMSGSYTVTVTNASTCSATSTATVVTVNALPTATITAASATNFCQGGSVVLNANTGTGLSYQWRLNGNPISGATSSSYTANASGSYTVVVTNPSTCSSTSNATVVTVNALPVASISPNGLVEICQGQSIALTANGGVSYLWSTGAPTQSITVNTEALYTVTVTDINGCTDTESQFVKVNLLPNIGVNNASICVGQSATLTATGGLSYVWSPVTGLSATTGSTVSSSTTSTTVYTVIGTGANGCTNSATATVTVNALPTATITPATATTFCQGGSVVLNANTGAGLTYQWFNNTSAISGATSASYTATMSGSYTVTVTNASTCSSTSTAVDVTTIANVDYFADFDGDGFGDITTLISTCIQPQGYVTNSSDCKDNNAAIFPGAQEICNDIDDDCNELIDDGLVFTTYYLDADGDSFGDINNPLDVCSVTEGYVTNNTDCNDNNANQNAASAETCNGEDDDCDGTIDNGLVFLDYYSDVDGDGFGTGDVINSCTDLGAGYTDNNTDCDDTNGGVYPGAEELCNSIDDNCDGQTDVGTLTVFFIDNDGDTYGNPSVSILACIQPDGYTPDDNDCNDNDANINPGAEDIGGNGIDENCDGEIDNSIFELNASINLFPNPTRSELNIQINNALVGNEMFIFDAVGKLVYKQQLLSTQTTISVSNLADGNYIFRVGELVKRFVVEK